MTTTIWLDGTEVSAEGFVVDVRRGRSNELEWIEAGGGTIQLRNYAANFLPQFYTDASILLLESGDALLLESGDNVLLESLGAAGDYGAIAPGMSVEVRDGAVTVFTGHVEDWDYDWDYAGVAHATMIVRDALASVGGADLSEFQTTPQLPGARIGAVLSRDEVGFPNGVGDRDIATGTVPLQGDLVDAGTNALAYLQKVAQTEFGRLFVDRTGTLVFQDRYESFGAASVVSFDDASNEIPFREIGIRYGTDLLIVSAEVIRVGGLPQVVTNDAAAAAFAHIGVRQTSISGLLYDSDAYSAGLAGWLVERYSTPLAVVSRLLVRLESLSAPQRAVVAALEIGQVVDLSWTPRGASGAIFQTLAIEGIGYSASPGGATDMELSLSPAPDPQFFVLDTDTLDAGKRWAW